MVLFVVLGAVVVVWPPAAWFVAGGSVGGLVGCAVAGWVLFGEAILGDG